MNQQTLLAHIPHILNDKDRLLKASFIEPKKKSALWFFKKYIK